MSYWIDRTQAFRSEDVVVALNARRREARLRVVLADGSLYDTRTRPQTFARAAAGLRRQEGIAWPNEATTKKPRA